LCVVLLLATDCSGAQCVLAVPWACAIRIGAVQQESWAMGVQRDVLAGRTWSCGRGPVQAMIASAAQG
jgi:hypothetical protein